MSGLDRLRHTISRYSAEARSASSWSNVPAKLMPVTIKTRAEIKATSFMLLPREMRPEGRV